MEWEFRKVLDSIESYRAGSGRFVSVIEKGAPGALPTLVREIELVVSDSRAKIISKVLAMRFAKDIMVLGRQDVVTQLTKLVPHMLKVCSYHLESDDPNRGETYFNDHPQFLSVGPDQKAQIQRYASTYFTLNMESIYHWAKWVPADEHGNESIYSKGLNTLLERGVKFNNNYSYYKNSDTDKFKNTYHVEFFTEDSVDFESNMSHSRASIDSNGSTSERMQSVEKIINNLYVIEASKTKKPEQLQLLHRKAVSLLQKKYPPTMLYYGKQKNDRKWLENFIVNYNLLQKGKITYDQFMRRSMVESIDIADVREIEQDLVGTGGEFKKTKTSAKRQLIKKAQGGPGDTASYEQVIKKQEIEYKDQKDKYSMELIGYQLKLEEERQKHEKQIKSLIQDNEERIKNIKMQLKNSSITRNEGLLKQNMALKEQILQLQRNLEASRLHQLQKSNLAQQYNDLKAQNVLYQKRERTIRPEEENLIEKIRQLEKQVAIQRQGKNNYGSLEGYESEIAKKNKQIENLSDEIMLYKNTLKNQRQSYERKIQDLRGKLAAMDQQNKNLKQKVKNLQKRIDLKQIESIELNQHVKLLSILKKQDQILYTTKLKQKALSQSPSRVTPPSKHVSGKSLKTPTTQEAKKYEKIRSSYFRNEKQRFLRFCRCGLKKKDLLMKQNQIQIGLISQPISNSEVKFLVHITNNSSAQINEIRLLCETSGSQVQAALETEYIFCMMPHQQEKVNVHCSSSSMLLGDPYQPVFLHLTYIKNNRTESARLVLPFLLFKTLQLLPPSPSPSLLSSHSMSTKLPPSRKMVPSPDSLLSYFPPMKLNKNAYQCNLLHRQSNTMLRLSITVAQEDEMEIRLIPEEVMPAGRWVREVQEEVLGFLELCFKR